MPSARRWRLAAPPLCIALAFGVVIASQCETSKGPAEGFRKHYAMSPLVESGCFPASTEPALPTIVETPAGAEVILYEDRFWRLARVIGISYLNVYRRAQQDLPWESVHLSLDWRRNTYPMAVAGTANALYVVGYDVVANVPSGRRLESVRNGVDVDQICDETSGHPFRLAEGLELGGIDTRFVIAATGDGVVVSGTNRIVSLAPGKPPLEWDTSAIRDHEIVEINFNDDAAAAIIRRLHDDRRDGGLTERFACYELATLGPKGCSVDAIPRQGVPWKVQWTSGKPDYRLACDPAELAAVFVHDFHQIRLGGVMDLGGNNLEGRVAWSQSYYLHGMLSMLSGPLIQHLPDAQSVLRKRAELETNLLAQLVVTDWPGLMCQRYSVGREPLRFALHVGRTLELLLRAERVLGPNEITSAAIFKLDYTLSEFRECVETLGSASEGGLNFETMTYRRGFPFWADGCNVPFNFLSGVACGLLGGSPSDVAIQLSERLMQPLLSLELSGRSKVTWRYWWSRGDAGWSRNEAVSSNTPSWNGNKGMTADISYRSIDALAVLALARCRPGSVTATTVSHLRDLTAQGWLWPLVNQELERTGTAATLTKDAAMRFARSSTASGLQSQPWALADLARRAPR